MRHSTGFSVWGHGIRTWHRTMAGAERRLSAVSRWASDAQILDCATGERVG